MSHSSDSKSQVGDSNVTTTMGKIKVKTGGKKGKNVEEIMQDFLEEKDKEKCHYFIDKLDKKDSCYCLNLMKILNLMVENILSVNVRKKVNQMV